MKVCSVVHVKLKAKKYKCLVINVCCMVNLADGLWEKTWHRWNRHLTGQFVACYELVKRGLATLPRLNSFFLLTHWWCWPLWIYSPHYFFSLLKQNPGTIHHADHTPACDCGFWDILRSLRRNAEHTPHRWTSLFETPNSFPLEMHLGQRSCSPASLWWAYLLLGSALGSTACI